MKYFLTLILVALFALSAGADTAKPLAADTLAHLTFEQKLGAQVSLDTPFRDESGRTVTLGDYLGKKPAILVLGYYGCPMLCTFVLNGMIGSLQDIPWEIGNQFEVINVSIDPTEGPLLAAAKKKSYVRRYGRHDAAPGWHFLTGDEANIRKLANEVGFNYAYDPAIKQYAHPSGLIVLTPEGKISHYLSGVVFSAQQLNIDLRDAAVKKVGSPIQQLFLLCFHYSPITGKYGALIMLIVRITGVAVLLVLVGGIVMMKRAENRKALVAPNQREVP